MMTVIGRQEEIQLLTDILHSGEPQLVAMYGRRRVGKTYLIRNLFHNEMAFEISGLHNATQQEQLENFSQSLAIANRKASLLIPANWLQAFKLLTDILKTKIKKTNKVIFFDEFPWLDTPRSGFMQAFENFWNTWASRQKNLSVIICGSAASWMIKKVVNNKGGLHNRVTKRIRLLPFTLAETEDFFKSKKINLDRYQVLQLYMAIGGIPQYLKEVKRGESATQAIDRICFSKDGVLTDEFKNLYTSLFDNAPNYIAVIKSLAAKSSGLTRNEIIKAGKFSSGGGITQILDELAESGFVKAYIPFGKTNKDSIYKLTDQYSLFYLKFMARNKVSGKGAWIKISATPSWKSWSGYAFESICQNHMLQLKKALGISGVHTEESAWRNMPATKQEKGVQIDLLIDRNDQCINICEMKFSINEFEVSKSYSNELLYKQRSFLQATKTRKTTFITLVTTYGVKNIDNYAGVIQNEITMDALFKR